MASERSVFAIARAALTALRGTPHAPPHVPGGTWRRSGLVALAMLAPTLPAMAAGSGAGAGGSGHQRAINSGLPAGEAGPPGSPNHPRPATTPPSAKGAPHDEGAPAR